MKSLIIFLGLEIVTLGIVFGLDKGIYHEGRLTAFILGTGIAIFTSVNHCINTRHEEKENK
jgi:hypothetical protein